MKNYKIAVAGTGYVGLSLGVLFAQHHQVVAVDIVQAKVDMINNKKSPIQDDYIEKYLAEKDLNLTATLDAKAAYHTARQERRKPKGEILMKNKKYYIAYGSNLSVEQMAYRCPDAKIAGQAVLAGWELLFRGCATIAPNPKKNTPVLVWEISERDEGNLDLYEGYPNYYRKEDLNIELLREEAEPEMVTAMVYIMENDFGHRAPSRYYYKVLHDGYKAFHFPMHILEGALKECMDKDAAQRMIEEVQA